MPATPSELLAAVPDDPLRRFCLVSEMVKANNNYLGSDFAAQRLADLALVLNRPKPPSLAEIAHRSGMSRQNLSVLAARALGVSRA